MDLELRVLPGDLAVVRLGPAEPVPDWVPDLPFCSVTRTTDELSLICPIEAVPPGLTVQAPWRCLEVAGPLDFSLVGILSGLSGCLARAGICLLAVSTYNTDYLLLPRDQVQAGILALRRAGYTVTTDPT